MDYHISVKCGATSGSFSAESTTTVTTNGASYTVSIPGKATAGGNPFKDLSQNVATFIEDNKESSVDVSFAAPSESSIPAGTYQGSINFEISYTQ